MTSGMSSADAPFTARTSPAPTRSWPADTAIGGPRGGFFLWLNMAAFGGGEAAAKTLWKGCGVRVLPGAYLAQAEPDGVNPGTDYIRVALVHNADVTREALTRIVATLG